MAPAPDRDPDPTPAELRDAALRYADLGYRVVPLHHIDFRPDGSPVCSCGKDCGTSAGKHPRVKEWQKAATTDADAVRAWWAKWPRANVGAALGSGSGIVAADVDPPNGDAALLEMSAGDLPDTAEMTTGKGRRPLYAVPEGLEDDPATAPFKDAAGNETVRLQSTGAQCVMPPSMHYSGRRYAWVEGLAPWETPPAPMPAWAIRATAPMPKNPAWSDQGARDAFAEGSDFNRRADWWRDVLEPVGFKPAGKRGDVLDFTRPGKGGGISVTVGYYTAKDGSPALYVFSGSIAGLGAGKCLDKFGAFARLHYQGDFREASARIAAMGFERKGAKPSANGTHKADGAARVRELATPSTNGTHPPPAAALVSRSLDEVEAAEVRWLWPGRVPFGMFTMLDGDPSHGKSLITLDLAARVSAGREMPLAPAAVLPPTGVLIIAAEDGAEEVIKPRCVAAGANTALVRVSETIRIGKEERPIRFPDDFDLLEREIVAYKIGLTVIDPLLGFLSQAVDSHKDQSVRDVLHQLKLLAARTGCAFIGLRHLSKGGGAGNAMYRGMGSIAISAAARSALIVATHPSDEDVRVLATAKCNLVKIPRSVTYRITDVFGRPVITWGEECDLKADDLGVKLNGGCQARDGAVEFLRELLADGPVKKTDIMERAKVLGISEITLNRAKKDLGIVPSKKGFASSTWTWELPNGRATTPEGDHPIPD